MSLLDEAVADGFLKAPNAQTPEPAPVVDKAPSLLDSAFADGFLKQPAKSVSGKPLRVGTQQFAPSHPVISAAQDWLGTPYVFGGTGRKGIDCSAFTRNVYGSLGVKLPRTAREQFAATERVDSPQPGDLVFLKGTQSKLGPDAVSHVMIYAGGGKVIQAASGGRSKAVRVDGLNSSYNIKHFAGFGRVKGAAGTVAKANAQTISKAASALTLPAGGGQSLSDSRLQDTFGSVQSLPPVQVSQDVGVGAPPAIVPPSTTPKKKTGALKAVPFAGFGGVAPIYREDASPEENRALADAQLRAGGPALATSAAILGAGAAPAEIATGLATGYGVQKVADAANAWLADKWSPPQKAPTNPLSRFTFELQKNVLSSAHTQAVSDGDAAQAEKLGERLKQIQDLDKGHAPHFLASVLAGAVHSSPMIAGAMLGGRIAGHVAGSAAFGGAMFDTAQASAFDEALRQQKVDTSSKESLEKFFSNSADLAKARRTAIARGLPEATVNALLFEVAGALGNKAARVLPKETEQTFVKNVQRALQTGAVEAAGGAGAMGGGYAAGRVLAGEKVDPEELARTAATGAVMLGVPGLVKGARGVPVPPEVNADIAGVRAEPVRTDWQASREAAAERLRQSEAAARGTGGGNPAATEKPAAQPAPVEPPVEPPAPAKKVAAKSAEAKAKISEADVAIVKEYEVKKNHVGALTAEINTLLPEWEKLKQTFLDSPQLDAKDIKVGMRVMDSRGRLFELVPGRKLHAVDANGELIKDAEGISLSRSTKDGEVYRTPLPDDLVQQTLDVKKKLRDLRKQLFDANNILTIFRVENEPALIRGMRAEESARNTPEPDEHPVPTGAAEAGTSDVAPTAETPRIETPVLHDAIASEPAEAQTTLPNNPQTGKYESSQTIQEAEIRAALAAKRALSKKVEVPIPSATKVWWLSSPENVKIEYRTPNFGTGKKWYPFMTDTLHRLSKNWGLENIILNDNLRNNHAGSITKGEADALRRFNEYDPSTDTIVRRGDDAYIVSSVGEPDIRLGREAPDEKLLTAIKNYTAADARRSIRALLASESLSPQGKAERIELLNQRLADLGKEPVSVEIEGLQPANPPAPTAEPQATTEAAETPPPKKTATRAKKTAEPQPETAEPQPEPSPIDENATGIANQVQAREAEAEMTKVIHSVGGKSAEEWQSIGQKLVDEGADYKALAERIAKGTEELTGEKVGILIEGKRRLMAELNRARNALDAKPGDADLINAYDAAKEAVREYEQNIQVGKGKWSDVGRALQGGVDIDTGDFAQVIAEYQRRGGKLTPEIEAKLKAQTEQIQKLEADLKDAEERASKARGTDAFREAGKRKRSATIKQLDEDFQSLVKQISEISSRISAGVDPEALLVIGKMVANRIERGALTLVQAIDEVLPAVRKAYPEITEREVRDAFSGYGRETAQRKSSEAAKALRSLKTEARLLSQIEDALKGEYHPGQRVGLPAARVRELRKQLDAILKEKGIRKSATPTSEESRYLRLKESLDNLLAGNKPTATRPTVDSARIAEVKAKLREVRSQSRLKEQIAEYEERIRTQNFELPTGKAHKAASAEVEELRYQRDRLRYQIQQEINAARPMTRGEKLLEVWNLPRATQAALDLSFALRQGGIGGLTAHPVRWAQAMGAAMKALVSEKGAFKAMQEIENSPLRRIAHKARLYIAPLDGTVTRREEVFISHLAENIPGVGKLIRASERHYVTMGNKLRFDLFADFVKRNPQATEKELFAWAGFLNAMTGRGEFRGSMAKYDPALTGASVAFYSPRFMLSRVQAPGYLANFLLRGSKPLRMEALKDVARTTATVSTALGLASLAGAKVGTDPDSPDFLKIRHGNTRYDILSGYQQSARLGLRILKNLRKPEAERQDPMELVAQFFKYKVSPGVSTGTELMTGKNVLGQKVSKTDTVKQTFMPLAWQEIEEAFTEQGISPADAAAVSASNILGVGTSTYEDKAPRKRRATRRRPARPPRTQTAVESK